MSGIGRIIGVSDHGGWAVLVTVARDGTLLDRRRIELLSVCPRLSPNCPPDVPLAAIYAAATLRIRSSCSALLSAPIVKASRIPSNNAYLIASVRRELRSP